MRSTRWSICCIGVVAACAAACGDLASDAPAAAETAAPLISAPGTPHAPCNRSAGRCLDTYFVAHEDDDLLFMNPDILRSIQSGNDVWVVYENGDQHPPNQLQSNGQWLYPENTGYDLNRERGILNAYAIMANVPGVLGSYQTDRTVIPATWSKSQPSIPALRSGTLVSFPVAEFDSSTAYGGRLSIVFLRVADFEVECLWRNTPGCNNTHDDSVVPYVAQTRACGAAAGDGSVCPEGGSFPSSDVQRSDLIAIYVGLLNRALGLSSSGEVSISTLDSTNINFDDFGLPEDGFHFDYWDHHFSALFVQTAATQFQAHTTVPVAVRAYRGYTISQEPQNLSDDDEAPRKAAIFQYYAMFDADALKPCTNDGKPCAGGSKTSCTDQGCTDPGDAPETPTPSDYLSLSAAYIPDDNYRADNDTSWPRRKYATRSLVGGSPLQGRWMVGPTNQNTCLGASGTTPTLVDCSTAPSWTLTTTNQIQLTGTANCLAVNLDPNLTNPESVSLAACAAADRTSSTMFAFANGQIRTADARCLTTAAPAIQSAPCVPQMSVLPGGDPTPHAIGFPPVTQNWTLVFDNLQLVSSQFSDATEIASSPSYYRSFGIANRNVCVRRSDGLWCAGSNGNTTTPALLPASLVFGFSDATGWFAAEHAFTVAGVWDAASGTTVACGRAFAGATCSNGLSTSEYSDAAGWTNEDDYATIRYVDLDGSGRISVCGRGFFGVSCVQNTGAGWGSTSTVLGSAFADGNGWTDVSYADTVQFGDVNGDGRLDVCGRHTHGIECQTTDAQFAGFDNDHSWSFDENRVSSTTFDGSQPDFSNADVYGTGTPIDWSSSPAYYASIKLVDINRDGFADVCGRSPIGIYCAFSTGTSFERKRLVFPFDFTDAKLWSSPQYGATISYGDLDGDARVDICGRGAAGVYCTEGY